MNNITTNFHSLGRNKVHKDDSLPFERSKSLRIKTNKNKDTLKKQVSFNENSIQQKIKKLEGFSITKTDDSTKSTTTYSDPIVESNNELVSDLPSSKKFNFNRQIVDAIKSKYVDDKYVEWLLRNNKKLNKSVMTVVNKRLEKDIKRGDYLKIKSYVTTFNLKLSVTQATQQLEAHIKSGNYYSLEPTFWLRHGAIITDEIHNTLNTQKEMCLYSGNSWKIKALLSFSLGLEISDNELSFGLEKAIQRYAHIPQTLASCCKIWFELGARPLSSSHKSSCTLQFQEALNRGDFVNAKLFCDFLNFHIRQTQKNIALSNAIAKGGSLIELMNNAKNWVEVGSYYAKSDIVYIKQQQQYIIDHNQPELIQCFSKLKMPLVSSQLDEGLEKAIEACVRPQDLALKAKEWKANCAQLTIKAKQKIVQILQEIVDNNEPHLYDFVSFFNVSFSAAQLKQGLSNALANSTNVEDLMKAKIWLKLGAVKNEEIDAIVSHRIAKATNADQYKILLAFERLGFKPTVGQLTRSLFLFICKDFIAYPNTAHFYFAAFKKAGANVNDSRIKMRLEYLNTHAKKNKDTVRMATLKNVDYILYKQDDEIETSTCDNAFKSALEKSSLKESTSLYYQDNMNLNLSSTSFNNQAANDESSDSNFTLSDIFSSSSEMESLDPIKDSHVPSTSACYS